MHITKDRVVSIRYIMKNSNDEILENIMDGDPVSYVQGSRGIFPSLQQQLEGLKAGDKKEVYLTGLPGLSGEDFSFEVIIDDVRVALTEEVLMGYPLKINAGKCEAGCDCYSFVEQDTKK